MIGGIVGGDREVGGVGDNLLEAARGAAGVLCVCAGGGRVEDGDAPALARCVKEKRPLKRSSSSTMKRTAATSSVLICGRLDLKTSVHQSMAEPAFRKS